MWTTTMMAGMMIPNPYYGQQDAQHTNATLQANQNAQGQPTIDDEIERAEQQVAILKHAKKRDNAPTLDEYNRHESIRNAYDEYLSIRNLTLGTK